MVRLRQLGRIAAVLVVLASAGWAQEVGTIAALEGTVEIGRGGAWTAASIGVALRAGDELRTGRPGRLRAVFQDDSVLIVGDESHLVVDEQVFDLNREVFRSVIRLLKGKMRSLVSEYYKRPRAVYSIETPTAVSGVRGTEFVIVYDPVAEVTEVVGVSGLVEVHSVLDRVSRAVFVFTPNITMVTRGQFPTVPRRLTDKLFQQYLEGLEFIGNGRAEGLSVAHPLLVGSLVPPADRVAAFPAPPSTAAKVGVMPVEPGVPPYEDHTEAGLVGEPLPSVNPTGGLGIDF